MAQPNPKQRLIDQVDLTFRVPVGPLPEWVRANNVLVQACREGVNALPDPVPKAMEGYVGRQMSLFLTHMEAARDNLAKAMFYAICKEETAPDVVTK